MYVRTHSELCISFSLFIIILVMIVTISCRSINISIINTVLTILRTDQSLVLEMYLFLQLSNAMR